MKKRILCFGDSNTFGTIPMSPGRYDENTRWPARLGQLLGADYAIIEEGFGGRTTVWPDPVEGGYKSGLDYLIPCLASHQPLDLVILMLGTNDTKARFGLNAYTIAECNARLVRAVQQSGCGPEGGAPRVLLVAPPHIGEWVMDTLFAPIFGPQSPAISRGFAEQYARFAKLLRVDFFDASKWCEPSREDAVHLTREGQRNLAEGLSQQVRRILG